MKEAYIHNFSIRHILAFLNFRKSDNTSALHLEDIIKGKITNKMHKNTENVTKTRLQKGHYL